MMTHVDAHDDDCNGVVGNALVMTLGNRNKCGYSREIRVGGASAF